MHVFLLYAKDGVRPAEEHDPAVLSLHLDVAELLSYDLFGVSVDHLVSGHVGPPVFRPIVCAISLLRGARLILRFTQPTAALRGTGGTIGAVEGGLHRSSVDALVLEQVGDETVEGRAMAAEQLERALFGLAEQVRDLLVD